MINIIGGSGFIGTRLCSRLSKKNIDFSIIDKVVGLKYPEQTNIADIRQIQELRKSIDKEAPIVHLAAEHRDDVSPKNLYHDVNVVGAKNLCMIASERGISKIIFTSSVAVYGFAPLGTDESGPVAPFNEYGKTKWEAEQVFREWQACAPLERTLVIVRPTVVFGEGNRGNVYNLLKQITTGRFAMIGHGKNRKSMAYVENLAAFLEYSLDFNPGIHVYNYVDKPDFTMNQLVSLIGRIFGHSNRHAFHIPIYLGLFIGYMFDFAGYITNKKFSISAIRIKKFCSNSVYESRVESTGFIPPVSMMDAIESTVYFEFIEKRESK